MFDIINQETIFVHLFRGTNKSNIPLIPAKIAKSIELYRFREALSELMNLARLGNKYLTENEPWKIFKTDPDRVKTVMNISLQITANLAVLSEPFLPFTSKKLYKMLNLKNKTWDKSKGLPNHQTYRRKRSMDKRRTYKWWFSERPMDY